MYTVMRITSQATFPANLPTKKNPQKTGSVNGRYRAMCVLLLFFCSDQNYRLCMERFFISILLFSPNAPMLFRSGLRGERQQSAGPCDVSPADLRHAGRDGASVAALPVPLAAQHAPGWRRRRLGGRRLGSRQQRGLLQPDPE